MKGNLYKITNIVNGKIYIGKTYTSLDIRWKRHINDAFRNDGKNTKFQNAIRKYGPENFKIELIAQFEEGELEQKEIEYIKIYDSYTNGYNSTLGGDGYKTISISDDNIKDIISLYKEYKSISYVHEELDIPRGIIRDILIQNDIDILNNSEPLSIVMYDKYWNIIRQFNSISESYEYCKKHINDTIDSRAYFREINKSFTYGNICYGYRWQKLNDLIYEGKKFLTIFDKNEYIKNTGLNIHDIKGFISVYNCNRPLSGYDVCPVCGGSKAIINKLCQKCSKEIYTLENKRGGICKQCGLHKPHLNNDGVCNSCYQVKAKGKIAKPSREEMLYLLSLGLQVKEIANMYDRSQSTVSTWKKQYGL